MIYIFIAFVGLVVVLAIFSSKKAQERREALAAWASERGWSFDPSYDRDHDDEYSHFSEFRSGYARVAYNTMRGPCELGGMDCAVVTGDFRYKRDSGSGKNRSTSTYNFSYLIVHLPFATPTLLIRRESFFDKIGSAFGFDDIDFESEEFSRKFYVKSDDKRFAYDLCHARMMEHLLSASLPTIDIEAGQLCFIDGRSRWKPEQFEQAIAKVGAFLELWPEHVTRDLESRG